MITKKELNIKLMVIVIVVVVIVVVLEFVNSSSNSLLIIFSIYQNHLIIFIIGSILVRELWLGNLPEDLNEKKLRANIEMFGEVENVEYHSKVYSFLYYIFNHISKPGTSFAFIKFKKVAFASRANEGYQNLKMLLQCSNLKIAFSDHLRRKNIVSDHVDAENVLIIFWFYQSNNLKDDDLTSTIYIGFSTGATIAPEGVFREIFGRYGDVKCVIIKQSPPENGSRSYALVEMGNLVNF